MGSERENGNTTVMNSAGQLSEHEHRTLVIGYNDSAAPYPADQTIVELFEAQAARTPNDEAVRLDDRSLSYGQLNERANQVAAHLRTLGAGPERLVVLYMEHSIEAVCAILGVLKAGAAYAPVDPATTPKERLAYILQDISAGTARDGASPVVVTQSQLVSNIPGDAAEVVTLDSDFEQVELYPTSNPAPAATPGNLAYVIYTSGSTGKPKGVLIEHRSLVNYIWWANQKYCGGEGLTWPLFSSLAFDLTVTSIFTPLISGGRIVVYREDPGVHGMVVLKVIEDGAVDIVKLTPSHLAMIKDLDLAASRIRKLIVGGEDFKAELARDITRQFGRPVEIYNEYGPTEATVGCMIHRYDAEKDRGLSVPIGIPAANAGVYILDEQLSPVPTGVTGEMYLAGDGLARGYLNQAELTEQKFVTAPDPRQNGPAAQSPASKPQPLRLYKTGDVARWSAEGRMEFLGRADYQVKIGGMRIELGEIEARLLEHSDVRECVVDVVHTGARKAPKELTYCTRCGVASSLPGTAYDADGVCNLCRAFDSYKDKAQAYFKSVDEFKALVAEMKAARTGEYDCVVLFSGGKDSTFMLYKICALGLKPLAFTLDNGFLSDEAMDNVRRVVKALGVDHVFGTTPHMNEIFVDSLKQFSNVCNGCFKTIYTLATNLAHEKGIGYIVTGLSRGQFFETRLTEEVFKRKDFDVVKLDALVLDARKAYHRRQDAVSCHLAVDILQGDGVFDEIRFVDFYRYWSVSLEELYAVLKERGVWSRPSDTGRSTNCLINDVGIYLHKKQRGFHNYSLPYSWDVRLGQKTRNEAMEELEDEIDETRVKDIMAQIGYTEPPADEPGMDRLVAYYVSEKPLPVAEVRAHLAQELPDYMVPPYVVWLEKLPLTPNGKVDRRTLPIPTSEHMQPAREIVGPRNETEQKLAAIWAEVLSVEEVGIHDNFFEMGGHSLLAIRLASRIRDEFDVDLPIATLFETSTIAGLAEILGGKEQWTPSWSSLVPIRQEGSKPPLYLMHSHSGNVLEYHSLVRLMESDQPVYALQARGLDGQIMKDLSVEEMASAYLRELRSLQPKGPYFLGGFCFGGVLALEAAQQLTAAGEEVAMVVMMQSMHPASMDFKAETSMLHRLWYRATKRINLELENLSSGGKAYLVEKSRHLWERARARAAMKLGHAAENGSGEASSLSMGEIVETLGIEHDKAYAKYAPRVYAGPVVLFRASKQLLGLKADESLGWKGVLNGNLDVLEIHGHQQNLLLEPNVSRLAQAVTTQLKAAQERHAARV
jgi:amino acid adenylation domain-containing protein